jgi:hypothetical protein
VSLDHLRREGGTDIGHGVRIVANEYNGQIVGIIEEHPGKDGARCSGYVKFRGRDPNPEGRPSWVVEQEEPLTLSPSVLCTTCGHHGYVREGKWVPA